MSYIFLGGVFCASIYMKNDNNTTAFRESFGLILIPSSVTFLATLQLGYAERLNPYESIGYAILGYFIGYLIYNPKLIKLSKR